VSASTSTPDRLDRAALPIAWVLLAVSAVGFLVTFPLWLLGIIDEQMMLGITLVLSWAALWYAAFVAVLEARRAHRSSGD
jgi:hypothetical protein